MVEAKPKVYTPLIPYSTGAVSPSLRWEEHWVVLEATSEAELVTQMSIRK